MLLVSSGYFKEDDYGKLHFRWETAEGEQGDDIEYPVTPTIKEEYRYTHGGYIYRQLVDKLLEKEENFKNGDRLSFFYREEAEEKEKNIIIIKVKGGLVETVYSNLEKLDIQILDEDVIHDNENESEQIKGFHKACKELVEYQML